MWLLFVDEVCVYVLNCCFATPDPFVLTNKICLNQTAVDGSGTHHNRLNLYNGCSGKYTG